MTYVVTEQCIACKYTECVEACPVDCFYEGESMLAIHPGVCIDCGACEPECPCNAILPDDHPDARAWLELNREYSARWPNITSKHDPLPDAETHKGEDGKFEKYFAPGPQRARSAS